MNKKLILGLGSLAAAALPVTAIVSCGTSGSKSKKENNNGNVLKETKKTKKTNPLETEIGKLNKDNLSEIIKDSNKLPSQVSQQEILDKIKDSQNFKSLDKAFLNKLLVSDISIVYTNDSTGVLSVKISNHPNDIKISSIPGFKRKTYTQSNFAEANDYKGLLSKLITEINSINDANSTVYYYEPTDNKGKKYILPLIAKSEEDLNKLDTELLKFAFNGNDIYSIAQTDVNNVVDYSKKIKSIFKIGYKSKRDNKFYLYIDKTKTSFDSKEDALEKYKESKKSGNFINFIKSELNSLKNQYALFGTPAKTSGADKMIKDSNSGVGDTIINALSTDQQANLSTLINKYIDNVSNSSQIASIYEKNASGKFMSGNNILSKGSGSFFTSFNVTGPDIKSKSGKLKKQNYGIVWGLLGSTKKNEIKFNEFKGFEKSIFPNVDKIAIIDAKIYAGSKNVSFVFVSINSKWLFLTDYINYIEGSNAKLPLTIKGSFKAGASEEAVAKKGFQDLVEYTKASLEK